MFQLRHIKLTKLKIFSRRKLLENKMSQFPLYTTLITNLPKKDLTIAQKRDFVRKVTDLDQEAHELVYALIKCYAIEHNTGVSFSLPYNGQLAKDRIEFDLLDFPIELRQLLYKFVTIHKKKLIEDIKIQKLQEGTKSESGEEEK